MDVKIENIPTYCMHLDDAVERYDNMIKEINYFNHNTKIVNAIKDCDGKKGLSYTVKKIILDAIENNYEYIILMEDDVKFTSDKSKERFQNCIYNLPENWAFLSSGSMIMRGHRIEKINDEMCRLYNFSCLHCVLIRNTIFEQILNQKTDGVIMDRYISQIFMDNHNIGAYICYPYIAIQYDYYSDIEKRNVDRTSKFEKFEVLV